MPWLLTSSLVDRRYLGPPRQRQPAGNAWPMACVPWSNLELHFFAILETARARAGSPTQRAARGSGEVPSIEAFDAWTCRLAGGTERAMELVARGLPFLASATSSYEAWTRRAWLRLDVGCLRFSILCTSRPEQGCFPIGHQLQTGQSSHGQMNYSQEEGAPSLV